ncbi:EAL domain-containing protein [Luteimonas vadosa]|uniref:EAL domain-containing protein n=1 Tax=Luteimonas vadosa TaxID=1165507 RepID=A0ABP9DPN5_9GAMM
MAKDAGTIDGRAGDTLTGRLRRLLWMGVLLSASLPLLGVGLALYELRQTRLETETRSRMLADAVARQLHERLLRVEHALAMRAQHDRHPSQAEMPQQPDLPLRQVEVLAGGPAGAVVRPPGQRLGIEPAVRTGAGWRIPIVYTDPSGIGVRAQLQAEWFAELLQGYPLAATDRINILHEQGSMIARSHDNAGHVGRNLPHTQLTEAPFRDQPRGHFSEAGALDGVDRLFTFQRLEGSPLLVVVSMASGGIVAAWLGFAIVVLMATVLLAVLWVWLLKQYDRKHARQGELLAELEVTRQRLGEACELAAIGDYEWDINNGRVHWSPEASRLYGLPPASTTLDLDQAFASIHPEDIDRLRGMAERLMAGDEQVEADAEFRIVRADGGVRWIYARGVLHHRQDRRVIHGVQQDITERVAAREQLRATEESYRFLFARNPLPMWVFDPDTLRFLEVNDAAVAHYGFSRERFLQLRLQDIRPGSEIGELERALARTEPVAQGRVWTHRLADGRLRRVAIFSSDIRFDGRCARMVLAQDVTESEAAEERFRLIARATSDAVYDFDIENDRLWWSDSFYSTFGYRPEEMPPTLAAWEAMVHPDDLARVSDSLEAAIADPVREEWTEEYRFRRQDAGYAVVVDRGFFVRNADGAATRMLGGMLDVSERRRHEADLRLLSRAVESVDSGVVIVDALGPDFPIVYVNRSFEQLTGYDAAEATGRNCRFLQGIDRDQAGVKAIGAAIAERREARALLRNYRKDGTLFWNELHVAPVQDEHGAVNHFVGVLNDVSERQRQEQELAHRATHDELTGLPNRQLLQDRLQQAIHNADRYGRKAAVVFLDLDDFKLVNDTLDHAAGDQALRIVADRLRQQVRETDTVGRFGGDEFVVVLTEQSDEDGVGQVIARISATLSQPMEIGDIQHVLTPSIGWSRYPEDGSDPETLLKHADMAMYQAKRAGRNRAERYHAGLDVGAMQRLQLVGQLRDALERREFVLAFQPIHGSDGAVSALECLVRWQHPERGLLSPAEFIPVCEESGLILELGRRILREAARHQALLVGRGFAGLRLAVNVSPLQFGPQLVEDVAAVLAEHSLPAGALELELTEGTVMDNPLRAIETMHSLSAMGVCLAIDDFGTGYSSLSYLKRLPLDRLKIDRSFVQDLPGDPESASLCSTIIGLAHSMGLHTVGEGVEEEGQLAWLRAQGCEEMQGFLMSRPLLFDDLVEYLDRGSAPART